MNGRRSTTLAALALFFCSGALGLGYELVWIRKAALLVGASQLALSTVLTSFFVGLGVGGLVVGRSSVARRLSPLLTYALFEIGIGAWALVFPSLFAGIEALYGAFYPAAAASGTALFALRFLLLFALCLPPTFLMGGTLPLLLDGIVREKQRIGSWTSLLYGLNVLGAVFGVLATSYLAIPRLGMNGTSRVCGLANLALGAVALLLFRGSRPLHAEGERAERPAPLFSALAFFSGTLAISWQICHARFFSLLDVTTVYSSAMLLAVWLLGLAAGSLLLSPLLRRGADPLRVLAIAQWLVPLAGLLSFGGGRLVDFSYTLGAREGADGVVVPLETMQVLPRSAFFSETVDTIFLAPLLEVGLVVLAPVVLLGVGLPALIAAGTRSAAALRPVSGSLVFWNTLGSSAGAFLAGYLLLPLLGLHRSLAALGLASAVLGGVAWRAAGRSRAPLLVALGAAAPLAFLLFASDLTERTLGGHAWGGELAEVVEDAVGTASVYESDEHVLLASGAVAFASAAKHGPAPQAIQGHLPVLFFPGEGTPRHALGIGLGSGQSFGALLMYPISSLDVVDIFPGLVDLSLRRFAEYNHGLGQDARVRFHFDDGRHFVARAAVGHYDVISMEPPPPHADGVFSLYSVDFYREVRRVLARGGVFMQWLPLYRVTPQDALGILHTQAAVFPETFLVKHADEDFMVLSFKERPTFSVAALRRRASTFARERRLAGQRWSPRCAYEIASFEGVASTILAAPAAIAALEAPALFEDDTQLLSYGGGDRWLLERYRREVSRITFAALPESAVADFGAYFSPPLDEEQVARLESERALSLELYNVTDPLRLARWRALAASGPDLRQRVRGHLALAAAHDVRLQKTAAFARVRAALALDPQDAEPDHVALVRRIVRNHFAVYHDETTRFVAALRSEYPTAPLVRALGEVYDAAELLEEQRRSRYLFPER